MLCVAVPRACPAPQKCQHPATTMVTPNSKEQVVSGECKRQRPAKRVQIAGLWKAACSLALALLRTVFDVLEVIGR